MTAMTGNLDGFVNVTLSKVNWANVVRRCGSIIPNRLTGRVEIVGWLTSHDFRVRTLSRILGVEIPEEFWNTYTNLTVKLGVKGITTHFERGTWYGGFSPNLPKVYESWDLSVGDIEGVLSLASIYGGGFKSEVVPSDLRRLGLSARDPYFHFDWGSHMAASYYYSPEVRLVGYSGDGLFLYDYTRILLNDDSLGVANGSAYLAATSFLKSRGLQ